MTHPCKERWQEELEILEVQTRTGNCPNYLRLMKAEILASQDEWPEAWAAISGLLR